MNERSFFPNQFSLLPEDNHGFNNESYSNPQNISCLGEHMRTFNFSPFKNAETENEVFNPRLHFHI